VSHEPDSDGNPAWLPIVMQWDFIPDWYELELVDAAGTPVTLGFEEMASEVTATVDGSLTPSSSYTAELRWEPGGQEVIWTFDTGPWGPPLEPEAPLADTEWALRLGVGTAPPGFGPVLLSLFGQPQLALRFDSARQPWAAGWTYENGGGNLEVDRCAGIFAPGAGPDGTPDSDDDVAASWDGPRLSFGPTQVPIRHDELPTVLWDARFAIVIAPDASSAAGGTLEGWYDTRPLELLYDESTPCEILEERGTAECVACPDGSGDVKCHAFRIEGIRGEPIEPLPWGDDSLPGPIPPSCEDLINRFEQEGECGVDAGTFDSDGDGVYEGCPAYEG
jgi:hypothetical protein